MEVLSIGFCIFFLRKYFQHNFILWQISYFVKCNGNEECALSTLHFQLSSFHFPFSTRTRGSPTLRPIGAMPKGRPTSGGPERQRSGAKRVPKATPFFKKKIVHLKTDAVQFSTFHFQLSTHQAYLAHALSRMEISSAYSRRTSASSAVKRYSRSAWKSLSFDATGMY